MDPSQQAFTFNFLSEEAPETLETNSPPPKSEIAETLPGQELSPIPTLRKFRWVENTEALLEERSQEELIYKDIPINSDHTADDTVRMVDLKFSSYRKASEKDSDNDRQPERNEESDIVSGVYEGGNKIWECSFDLVEYLSTSLKTLPSRVWEIGCGHGLPGCYLLNRWIVKRKRTDQWSVVLSDFNEEVVLDATISNIVLNSHIGIPPSDDDEIPITVKDVGPHVELGSGDWNEQSRQMLEQGCDADIGKNGKFDLILAAETLYTEKTSKDTAELLMRHLDATKGVAFIATKRYYFGVGGGVDCFRGHAAGLSVKTVKVIDNGGGNIREVLEVRVEP